MLSEKMEKALNGQINVELQAAYSYFAMAIYFDSKSLDGFSHWMKMQAKEEMMHAVKIYDYLSDTGHKAEMLAIPQPKSDYGSVLEVFEAALKSEEDVSIKLNSLADLALGAKDNTTYSFLEWFLTEQVEEVSVASTIVDKLRLIGDNGYGILTLNNEMKSRKAEETNV